MKNSFSEFDPLTYKSASSTEAALGALKREIKNILSSYTGWYDPFSELIQNALDAIELRAEEERLLGDEYKPQIAITIDINDNRLTVTDNGVGLTRDQFQQFLAPNFSFKSGATRGHKGVGATYVAYGFNYLQIATKAPSFTAIGKLINARKWLDDPSPSSNPKVAPDGEDAVDPNFLDLDRGVSITVRFDEQTHPKKLDWIHTSSAPEWLKILSIKTGLGAFFPNDRVQVMLRVIDKQGRETTAQQTGIRYYWIHLESQKKASFQDIKKIERELFEKKAQALSTQIEYRIWILSTNPGILNSSLNCLEEW